MKLSDKKTIIFEDHPEFMPNLTPSEVFKLGSFGGTYFRPIKSSVTGLNYKDQHLEFPKTWFKGLDIEKYVTSSTCDESINYYKVRSGQSLKFWEDSGWIEKQDPYGWFQWYCRFYNGRRSKDDKRQIQRFINLSRWRNALINKCYNENKKYNDYSVRPVVRQLLQQWGYVLTKKDFDDYIKNKKKK